MIREKEFPGASGLPVLLLLLVTLVASIVAFVFEVRAADIALASLAVFVWLVSFIGLFGLYMVNPNESRVLQLFGHYVGTTRTPGLRWANPFYTKGRISVRTRNFETSKLKVNDKAGNPIEIAAVVVWRVVDTAEALFNVDDYINFVQVQSESAVRNLASDYPYVVHVDGEKSLTANATEVSFRMRNEIQERLEKAGVEVLEARISHLAYSPEIASAMLQRQQASAVVAARATIVEGAVGMVEHALQMLNERQVVDLDPEKRAAMVSNLLVVLCGDRHVQPVLNTGSLYQ
jgi:regulator of protease activity HflC (stomatin/prohibitin superfamily)